MCSSPSPPPAMPYIPPAADPAPDLTPQLNAMQETMNSQADQLADLTNQLLMERNKPAKVETVVQTEVVRPAGAPLPQMAPDPASKQEVSAARTRRKGRSSMRIKRKKQGSPTTQANPSVNTGSGGGASSAALGRGSNLPNY